MSVCGACWTTSSTTKPRICEAGGWRGFCLTMSSYSFIRRIRLRFEKDELRRMNEIEAERRDSLSRKSDSNERRGRTP